MQVASSEWTLGIQIQGINYTPRVEIQGGQYCCCNTSVDLVPCGDTITSLNVDKCTSECQYYVYYMLRIKNCSRLNEVCSVTESYQLISDTGSPFSFRPVMFPIPFDKSELHYQVSFRFTCKSHQLLYIRKSELIQGPPSPYSICSKVTHYLLGNFAFCIYTHSAKNLHFTLQGVLDHIKCRNK